MSEDVGGKRFAGGRYEALRVLGRGGSAVVYRTRDLTGNRDVALKQLTVSGGADQHADAVALFEREFRMLAELSHPSIIDVDEYGLDGGSPYYTMELVEGSDVLERAPLPWKDACSLLGQVCSALSLLHARGFVHRDVSPRNVRCTLDGRAKLLDFGAMAPMGASGMVVGTPAFAAPEVVYRATLDARSDLYSVGATLYLALTGRAAYPARDFSTLVHLWREPVEPPSRLVPDVPPALDALVMSLLSLEPALRPRSAAVVMQRLYALAGVPYVEAPDVSRAYLLRPAVVGRSAELSTIRADMAQAFAGEGRSVLIHAESGLGRTRLLDACVLEAKTSGATVLRSSAGKAGRQPFAVARELAQQLTDGFPDAEVQTDLDTPDAFAAWILREAQRRPLAIVVDDVEHIDDASGSLLAKLARLAAGTRLVLLMTIDQQALSKRDDAVVSALITHSRPCALGPLDRSAVAELFASVFGDVPNLRLISDSIFAVSAGNPRLSMDLAQCLVDARKITYEAGTWTLPAALSPLELPRSAEETVRQQLAALSGLARRLVELQVLATHAAFSREEYALLAPEHSRTDLDRAILELLQRQVLTTDGRRYTLSHRGWATAITSTIDDNARAARHRSLVPLYEGRSPLETAHHRFLGGLIEPALDGLLQHLRTVLVLRDTAVHFELSGAAIAAIIERGLTAAAALGRPARDLHDIRGALVGLSALITEEELYYRVAPAWLAQLELDSGYAAFQSDPDHDDPGARLTRALQHAMATYAQTPEHDRVYPFHEALRGLASFVAYSIAVAARTQDFALMRRLPSLLEPFLPLSRVIAAIHKNATALRMRALNRPERARELWTELHAELNELTDDELPSRGVIRNAVAAGVATTELSLGLPSAVGWAERLEGDVFHAVHALYLKRVGRLQQGDWVGAETLRKQAEERAVEARGHQMFTTSITLELVAYGMAQDLLGVKEILDRIVPLAQRFPGWVPWKVFAEAEVQRLRGDYDAAAALYRSALGENDWSTHAPDGWWPTTAQGYLETLIERGDIEQARTFGRECVQVCEHHAIEIASFGILRALALAEAKLGDVASATQRLERVIETQRAIGVTGLHLGTSYEARARVAICAGDTAALETFGQLAAREYRHGKSSPLGARYERLVNDARTVASSDLPPLSEFSSTQHSSEVRGYVSRAQTLATRVARVMEGATTQREREQRALGMLLTECGAPGGYLYRSNLPEPTLVAVQGLAEPGAELTGWVTALVARESEDAMTAVVQTASDAVTQTRAFYDSSGVAHEALLLLDPGGNTVGLAVLAGAVNGLGKAHALAVHLAACLGTSLPG